MIRRFLSLLMLAGLLSVSGAALAPVQADQQNPHLDTLFGNLQRAESYEEAAFYVNRIWDIWAEHDDPLQNSRMSKGILAMDDGDYVVAISIFSTIIMDDPDFAEGWNKRATAYYLAGQVKESCKDVTETLLREPRHFGALSGRGLLYAASGDLSKALRAFEEALAINPFMPSVRSHINALRQVIDEREI